MFVLQEHDIILFLCQLAGLIFVARLCGDLIKKIGFPGVIGELIGGLILGPTIL